MKVLAKLYHGYGETPTNAAGQMFAQGAAFLRKTFPKLDRILTARDPQVTGPPAEGARRQARRRHRRHERDRRGDEPPVPRGGRARRRRSRSANARSRRRTSGSPGSRRRCSATWPSAAQVERTFARVDDLLGGIDVLVANAGISVRAPFLEIREEDWRRVLDVNLTGVFHCAQQAARRMVAAGAGTILMTASTNGLSGHPFYADYNASKAGVILLARTMALELAPAVRVNAVCPGYVLTPMQRAEYSDEMLAEVDAGIPLGRHAQPGGDRGALCVPRERRERLSHRRR